MGVKERPFCRFWIGPTVVRFDVMQLQEILSSLGNRCASRLRGRLFWGSPGNNWQHIHMEAVVSALWHVVSLIFSAWWGSPDDGSPLANSALQASFSDSTSSSLKLKRRRAPKWFRLCRWMVTHWWNGHWVLGSLDGEYSLCGGWLVCCGKINNRDLLEARPGAREALVL
jgi:hypothetical protein